MTYENLITFINLSDINKLIGNKVINFTKFVYMKELFPKNMVMIDLETGIITEEDKIIDRYLTNYELKILYKAIKKDSV